MKHHKLTPARATPLLTLILVAAWLLPASSAWAIPAFARRYQVVCNVCHSREPRLNPFGVRFMENGYKMPAVVEDGKQGKYLLGGPLNGATLDRVSEYLAFRVAQDATVASFENSDANSNKIQTDFPSEIDFWAAGPLNRNVSVWTEFVYDGAEQSFGVERAKVYLTDLLAKSAGYQTLNIAFGNFDASWDYPYLTERNDFHLQDPLSSASHMVGMTHGPSTADSDGFEIDPLDAFGFNGHAQHNIQVYGRPNGGHFAYMVGLTQDDSADDDPLRVWPWYVMGKYDIYSSPFDYLSLGVFYNQLPSIARPTLNLIGGPVFANAPVDWNRYGASVRWWHKAFDIFGAVTFDSTDSPDFTGTAGDGTTWDKTGMGASVDVTYLLTEKWLLAVRYDYVSPGGLVTLPAPLQGTAPAVNQTAQFAGVYAQYYMSPNLRIWMEGNANLASAESLPDALGGDVNPARDQRHIVGVGFELIF
ncbi:MAG: hypothetical protein ACRET4_14620 [Steroidobacteraceae bacterium]